jgi:hypothetical protein
MNRDELIIKIKSIAKQALANRKKVETAAIEYDELTKFPELKKVIVNLLTSDFDYFLASIDWVAPRPTTFRVNLKNETNFYLMFTLRSWIAQIEGKKYYLLNLNEEEAAANAISRLLRQGSKIEEKGEEPPIEKPPGAESTPAGGEISPAEEPAAEEEATPKPAS